MEHNFLAFIDESGDDGLSRFRVPGKSGGATRWLVISACVFRACHSLDAVKWRDAALARINNTPNKRRNIHFCKLNHSQRVSVVRELSDKPIRAINILSDKTTIPNGTYTDKNQLYFYITRYLIERISWICRDARILENENRSVKITFSRRGGMSYDKFREYLCKLKCDETSIHWDCIDIDNIEALDHTKSASLQIADIIASSFSAGIEPDNNGNCEPRYAEILKQITYNRSDNYLSYGVKVIPNAEHLVLSEDQKKFIDLFRKEKG